MKFEIDVAPMLYTKDFKNKLFTEDQVWGIEKSVKNYQDFACLVAVFYGIKGANSCELINFKKENINIIDNMVKLPTKRTIHLPHKIIEVFKNSCEQKIYRRSESGHGRRITAELMESEYVIRPTVNNKRGYISAVSIAKRCKDILEKANYPNISINDICMSGKLDFLKYIQQKKGKQLEIDDYKKVNRHFGDGTTNYTILRELYKSIISDDELNVFSEKNLWDEIYLVDDKDNFLYEDEFSDEDENDMNNSRGDDSNEGGSTEIHIKRYARSRKARDRCIEIYGATCYICNFNFKQTYGEYGKGLIHVHHLNQLSKSSGKYIVNAREDLRPICPNCHLIIHKNKKQACSILDVEKMIEDNKKYSQ